MLIAALGPDADAHRVFLQKEIVRHKYVRVDPRQSRDAVLEVVKFRRERALLLSSLVDTDGLVEPGEDITEVKPDQMVGFPAYAVLM